MNRVQEKKVARRRIHTRIRTKLHGAQEKPRLCVFRSLKHIYAQVVDDSTRITLLSCSTLDPEVKAQIAYGGNMAAAKVVGTILGNRLKEKGITNVVFDRGGFQYHGRVKAVAEAVRKCGVTI